MIVLFILTFAFLYTTQGNIIFFLEIHLTVSNSCFVMAFSNYDAAIMLIKASWPSLGQHCQRA
jgi:hypothetical protein